MIDLWIIESGGVGTYLFVVNVILLAAVVLAVASEIVERRRK